MWAQFVMLTVHALFPLGFPRRPLWEFLATKRESTVFQSTAPPSLQEMRTLSSTSPMATERWVSSTRTRNVNKSAQLFLCEACVYSAEDHCVVFGHDLWLGEWSRLIYWANILQYVDPEHSAVGQSDGLSGPVSAGRACTEEHSAAAGILITSVDFAARLGLKYRHDFNLLLFFVSFWQNRLTTLCGISEWPHCLLMTCTFFSSSFKKYIF